MRSEPTERWSYRHDPGVPVFPDDKALIVFDGYCVLCSGWADFIRRHDRRKRLRLAVTQGELGRGLYAHYALDPDATNLLLKDGRAFTKSEAVLGVLGELGMPWSIARVLRAAPGRLREAAYDRLARRRFALFGRTDRCACPGPGDADRFLA